MPMTPEERELFLSYLDQAQQKFDEGNASLRRAAEKAADLAATLDQIKAMTTQKGS